MSSEKDQFFLTALAEALELENSALSPTTSFGEIEWDSLAVISAIALIDEHFGVLVSGQAISECSGVPDLLSLIKSTIND